MFAPADLAARIDAAEGRLCAAIAHRLGELLSDADVLVEEVGGGVAVYGGQGVPSNKLIGAGFEGPVERKELERVERAFTRRRAPLQAEVATLAAPEFHGQLAARGYVPTGFENVLGRRLATTIAPPPAGIDVTVVDAADTDRWVRVVAEGFAFPDLGGVGGDAIPPIDEVRRWMGLTATLPGFRLYEARMDGIVVGGGSIRIDGHLAQLSGASTLPTYRRRGVQTALLRARLEDAAAQGCEVAVVVTQPASKSQQNAQREGFHLLYARQLLVKQP